MRLQPATRPRTPQRPVRLQALSDIHAERGPWLTAGDLATDADIAVFAGDVAAAEEAVDHAVSLAAPGAHVVLVAGNHEPYGTSVDAALGAMRRAARRHDKAARRVVVLEDETVVITVRGTAVRFIGSTLWADFALFGTDCRALAMSAAAATFWDFVEVRGRRGGPFTPAEAAERHAASRTYLSDALGRPHPAGPTVLITHHLPTGRALSPVWSRTLTSAAYASAAEELLVDGPVLAVAGHVHESVRLEVGGCLLVANPAGGPAPSGRRRRGAAGARYQNTGFDPRLVVSLAQDPATGRWSAR